jgi:hypothetical protein
LDDAVLARLREDAHFRVCYALGRVASVAFELELCDLDLQALEARRKSE